MLTIQPDRDSKGHAVHNRTLVFAGEKHVGVIIERGVTGTGRDRRKHVNVITPFDNHFVGSMEEAMDAIRTDIEGTELSVAV